ncbi:type IV pilus assembly protein FimV [Ralstonia wenshanensis]|uniref:type IV pilus assembly protein FimV n=1 Tax=Ralstonia wenshanensis TaxID=2842456 RepID=UPI0029303725|nr:FimV/HubP family polar landmark protein [Ralstonia wenshanensis]
MLHLHSNIGQPLEAEIDLTGLQPHDAQALVLQPGNRESYLAAGVPYGASATSLHTTLVQRQDGSYVVRVYSTVPQADAIADIVLRLAGPGGNTLATYTVLLSPPGAASAPTTFLQTQRKSAPASGVSPPSSAQAHRPQTQAVAVASAPAVNTADGAHPSAAATAPSAGEDDRHAEAVYTVKAGDNLSQIALGTVQNRADVSAGQAALALYRSNPHAFIGGNINQLRVGATLRVPTAEEATAVASVEAERQLRMLTQTVATDRTPPVPEVNANAIAGSRPPSVPANAADKNTLRISATGPQEQAKVEQLNEELVAARQAIHELESRLAQVEQNLADMRRLAALKNASAQPAAASATAGEEGHAPDGGPASRSPITLDDPAPWKRAHIIGPVLGVLLALVIAALMFYRMRMRKVQSALAAIYTQLHDNGDPLTERGPRARRNNETVSSR